MSQAALLAAGGVILALAFGRPAFAAAPAQAVATAAPAATPAETVTLEPIECWWRTSIGSARVSELFTLVLTCAVVESAETTVVPDQSRLDPGVLQLPPFEVVRGTQATDVRTGIRRFFQYEYTLRYVGEDFGRDISLPPVTITYRVQSRMSQDAAVESRERQYILPSLMVRIVSLVPAIATDIRDQPAETFRETEARRFRANLLRVIAGVLYIVGAAVVVSGLAPVFRRRTRRAPSAATLASDGAILRRVSRELDEVRRLRGIEGWTDRLATQALAALRIVAAYAIGRPVAQVRGEGVQPSEGQLLVPRRWPKRDAALVSSAVTPVALDELGRRLEAGRAGTDGEGSLAGGNGAERLADLATAITRFAGKAYGQDAAGTRDADLDEAIDAGVRALEHARREHAWPAKARRAIASKVVRLRPHAAEDVDRSATRARGRS